MEYTKINDTEIKEIVPQPNIEIVHNLDDLIEKQKKAQEEIEFQTSYIKDLQVLIDGAKDLGCKTSTEIAVEKEVLQESIIKG